MGDDSIDCPSQEVGGMGNPAYKFTEKIREVGMRDSRSRKLQIIVNGTVSESFEERVGAQKTIHSIECEAALKPRSYIWHPATPSSLINIQALLDHRTNSVTAVGLVTTLILSCTFPYYCLRMMEMAIIITLDSLARKKSYV
jgi:hypothetical protein